MKQLTKVKVLMLPTEKASNTDIMPGKLCTSPRYNNGKQPLIFGEFENSYFNECVPQHLYLVSDEKIEDGDHFMSAFYGYPLQNTKEWREQQKKMLGEYPDLTDLKQHKIIATTDKSLRDYCKRKHPKAKIHPSMPQIPESFVEAFVKADGKINEVMVECEQKRFSTFTEGQIGEDSNTFYENILKTREDNTVIIHTTNNDKRYTLDDLMKVHEAICERESHWIFTKDEMLKWIKENL